MTFDSQHINRGGVITADFLNAVADAMIRRITVNGGRVSRIGGSVIIDIDKVSRIVSADGWFGRVTAHTAITGNYWQYTVRPVFRSGTGINEWTYTGDPVTAYNTIEVINPVAGTLGNGVVLSHLVVTDKYCFTLRPAPIGVIVRVYDIDGTGGPEHWFQYENGIDGECGNCE